MQPVGTRPGCSIARPADDAELPGSAGADDLGGERRGGADDHCVMLTERRPKLCLRVMLIDDGRTAILEER